MGIQLLTRFLIGGLVVSLFALSGDLLRPKSFAGVFGGAPSVALATLLLTLHEHGAQYVSVEARSMLLGAAALTVYAALCSRVLWSARLSSKLVTLTGLLVWVALVLGGWYALLRA